MRAPLRSCFAVLLALPLASCSSSDTTDTTEAPPAPATLPAAACGMTPYQRLDAAGLGELLSYDELPLLHQPAKALDALLADKGYTALSPVPYGVRTYRFRYTTQDRGQKVEATATMGIPDGDNVPTGELPFAVFLHGTSGFSDPCAPSNDVSGQAQAALIGALGFVSVAPDYIGMASGAPSGVKHGYLVGEQAALGSWDALRAGQKLVAQVAPQLKTGKKAVLWGGSQGGHAALFTELFGPYYAPEFEVPGVVASVPPTDLLSLVQIAVTGFSDSTVGLVPALVAMRSWYGAPADLTGVITDSDPFHFASTAESQIYVQGNKCNPGEAFKSIDATPEQKKPETIYTPAFIASAGGARWDELSPWACYFRENSLATTSVKPLRHTPTFFSFAENDNLVHTAPMRADFDRLCSQGYQIAYLECKGAEHSQGATWSLREQLDFLHDRLDGKPMPADTCQRKAPSCCSASPKDVCTPG